VPFLELGRVVRRRHSRELHSYPTARTGDWHGIHNAGLHPDVAAHAALTGVARDAVRTGALRVLPMRADEVGGFVTWRGWQR